MANIINTWKTGLKKTSKAKFEKISKLFHTPEFNEGIYDELEALLIQADIGVDTSLGILTSLRERAKTDRIINTSELKNALKDELRKRLSPPNAIIFPSKPAIIMIVGVNGSGKTTTIAKLGKRYLADGSKVVFCGADTFRAAAADQLQVWANRLEIPVVVGQQGGDAGAVAYDAVKSAIKRNADLLMIDTAGRLHTRYNLMEEIKKVHRVIGKAMPQAPHEVWLVMDATTGQNAFRQAEAFKDAVKVTGIILAKLDTSARGGMVFAIQDKLQLPVLFVGLGEKPDDLHPFDPDAFINNILGNHI